MENRLLVKSILCALGTGVIINLGTGDTAYASENKNDYVNTNVQQSSVSNQTGLSKQEQLERIQTISKEIADINARLTQLTEELNRYNEQLNNAQVNDNPQIDIDTTESFNENRQIEKRSKIPMETANDFGTEGINSKEFTGNTEIQSEQKEAAPIKITSKQIHQDNYNVKSTATVNDRQNTAIEKERYIAQNRDDFINNERKNMSFDYNENGFTANNAPYSYLKGTATNSSDEKITSQNIGSTQLKNDTEDKINTENNTKYFTADKQPSTMDNNIVENKNVNVDNERKNITVSSNDINLKTDEAQNIIKERSGSFNSVENTSSDNLQQNQKKYISSEYVNRNRNISSIQQNNGVKIERNEAVMPDNERDNFIDLKKMTMIKRFNSPAPVWTYEYFDRLSADGLLYPDKDFNLNNLTRREAAILTARSYNLYKIKSRHVTVDNSDIDNNRFRFISDDIDTLMKEFAPEVQSLGYNMISEVTDTGINYRTEWDWKYEGELRFSASKNGGSPKYHWSDRRVYGRVLGQKALSDDWKVNALLESEYDFFDEDRPFRDKYDGDVELSRIYLEGKKNWWNIPFTIELGKEYAYLADGNILDGDFKGVKISADVTPKSNYTVGYGKVNDSETAYYLEALTQNRNYNYLAGIYHWDNYNNPTTIYALGMNCYVGDWTLGGMYLDSTVPDGSGAKDGYVLTARYKQHFAWVPHSYDLILKYYNMAGNTYINHTMNGVGSYMDGFSGWGAMLNYTLAENWVLSLEYYDLKDKTTDEKGKTAWAQLSWFFD